jgi:hypothetical protein
MSRLRSWVRFVQAGDGPPDFLKKVQTVLDEYQPGASIRGPITALAATLHKLRIRCVNISELAFSSTSTPDKVVRALAFSERGRVVDVGIERKIAILHSTSTYEAKGKLRAVACCLKNARKEVDRFFLEAVVAMNTAEVARRRPREFGELAADKVDTKLVKKVMRTWVYREAIRLRFAISGANITSERRFRHSRCLGPPPPCPFCKEAIEDEHHRVLCRGLLTTDELRFSSSIAPDASACLHRLGLPLVKDRKRFGVKKVEEWMKTVVIIHARACQHFKDGSFRSS